MKINKKLLLGATLGFAFLSLSTESFATAQYDVLKQSLRTRGLKNPTDEDAKVFAATEPTQRKALLDKWLAAQTAGKSNADVRTAVGTKTGAAAVKAVDDLMKARGAGAPPPPPPAAAKVYTAASLKDEIVAPELTDEALADDVAFANTLTADEQKAIIDKIKKEIAALRAEPDFTVDMLADFWEHNTPYESWELYKKNIGKGLAYFHAGITSVDLLEEVKTFFGLKDDATDANIQAAFTAFKADIVAKVAANPLLKKYYDEILPELDDLKARYDTAPKAPS